MAVKKWNANMRKPLSEGGTTICEKHEFAIDNYQDADMAWEVAEALRQAKDDGERMEKRLQELGEEANNLEDVLKDAEEDLSSTESQLAQAREDLERVRTSLASVEMTADDWARIPGGREYANGVQEGFCLATNKIRAALQREAKRG